ncbi:MAG: rRNA cytosine-C5-methyltransferase, partial [Bacteroidales bacterium]
MSVVPENKGLFLPQEFKDLAVESLGEEIARGLFSVLEQGLAARAGIRLNPSKISSVEQTDFSRNISGRVPWCDNGFYLTERPKFTLDPLFHAGGYYVQEASSMYMELVKKAIDDGGRGDGQRFFDRPLRVLDLCAAPGGKTTHLASLLGEDSLLVSNEVIKSRAVVLADNVAKWGAPNVIVTNNDPKDFTDLDNVFNLVVVDAPCSGEGLFRKDNEAVNEWSLANVKLCSQRQKRILADVWPALAPGGFLVYSTCTYNHYENDDTITYITQDLGAEVVPIHVPVHSGILRTAAGGIQFVPGLVEGEGQFMAVIRKPLTESDHCALFRKCSGKHYGSDCKNLPKQNKITGYWVRIMLLGNLVHVPGDLVKGYPDGLMEDILFFQKRLRVVLSGVAMGQVKGKDLIPHADLALSIAMQRIVAEEIQLDGIEVVEVDRGEALTFLAKEPLIFPGQSNGYLLLTYKGLGLGFVKNMGNRTNNLLPMARRIRMDIK